MTSLPATPDSAPTVLVDDTALLLADIRADSVICALTSARMWRSPLPPWIAFDGEAPIVVSAPPAGSHTDRPGVRGRRLLLPAEHVTLLHGLPVTTPARTWLDCAAEIPLPYLVAMGDDLLHRGLTTEQELAAITHWAYRRRDCASSWFSEGCRARSATTT